jgi:hypothetical protein
MLKKFLGIFFCAVILGQSACNNDEPIENSSDAQPISTKTQIEKKPPKPELNRWDVADRETIRLQPSIFSQLPENIVMELQSRQCTIPQIYDDPKPHNVINRLFCYRDQVNSLAANDLFAFLHTRRTGIGIKVSEHNYLIRFCTRPEIFDEGFDVTTTHVTVASSINYRINHIQVAVLT